MLGSLSDEVGNMSLRLAKNPESCILCRDSAELPRDLKMPGTSYGQIWALKRFELSCTTPCWLEVAHDGSQFSLDCIAQVPKAKRSDHKVLLQSQQFWTTGDPLIWTWYRPVILVPPKHIYSSFRSHILHVRHDHNALLVMSAADLLDPGVSDKPPRFGKFIVIHELLRGFHRESLGLLGKLWLRCEIGNPVFLWFFSMRFHRIASLRNHRILGFRKRTHTVHDKLQNQKRKVMFMLLRMDQSIAWQPYRWLLRFCIIGIQTKAPKLSIWNHGLRKSFKTNYLNPNVTIFQKTVSALSLATFCDVPPSAAWTDTTLKWIPLGSPLKQGRSTMIREFLICVNHATSQYNCPNATFSVRAFEDVLGWLDTTNFSSSKQKFRE